MMRFFDTLLGSFYSPETYQEARRAQGYGFGYSFLLVVATVLVIVVNYTILFHHEVFGERQGRAALFDDVVMQIANQIPQMTLQNNQLQTQLAQPYPIFVHAELFGQSFSGTLATIDTTGGTTYQTMQTPILVTAHELVMRNDNETKIKSYQEMTDGKQGTLVINRAVAEDVAKKIIQSVHQNCIQFYVIFGMFAWAIGIAILYVLRLAMLLVLGLAGLAISNALKSPLDYPGCVRLAGVAYTPVAVLSVVLLIATNHGVTTIYALLAGLVMLVAAFLTTRETLAGQA